MSDKEASPGAESETNENVEGSPAASNEDNDSPKISVSRSASRSPSHSKSRSRSASEEKPSSKKRSRSRSRSGSRRRRRSPGRSRKRSYRSRSRSYERRRSSRDDYYYDEGRGGRNYGYDRRSPFSYRKRHRGDRENPGESRCLGVFGLSLHTQERDLRDIFSHYGPVENVQVVYDHQTGRSRGFAFIYMKHVEDALEAKERAAGTEIDGRKIRVDFSITERAHTPTPGVYLGRPGDEGYSRRGRGGGGSYGGGPGFYRQRGSPDYYSGGGGGRRRYSRSRSRSYSPRRY